MLLSQASKMLSHTVSPLPQTWYYGKIYFVAAKRNQNLTCAKRAERSWFRGCHLYFNSQDAMKESSQTWVCDYMLSLKTFLFCIFWNIGRDLSRPVGESIVSGGLVVLEIPSKEELLLLLLLL